MVCSRPPFLHIFLLPLLADMIPVFSGNEGLIFSNSETTSAVLILSNSSSHPSVLSVLVVSPFDIVEQPLLGTREGFKPTTNWRLQVVVVVVVVVAHHVDSSSSYVAGSSFCQLRSVSQSKRGGRGGDEEALGQFSGSERGKSMSYEFIKRSHINKNNIYYCNYYWFIFHRIILLIILNQILLLFSSAFTFFHLILVAPLRSVQFD